MIKSRDVTIYESDNPELSGLTYFSLREAEEAEKKHELTKYLLNIVDTKHLSGDEIVEECVEHLLKLYNITMK